MNQSNKIIQFLFDHIKMRYDPDEYPALHLQWKKWDGSRPLEGIHVLDATPLFTNTLVKYIPLIAAGAELTAATHDDVPFDASVVPLLEQWGIPHVHNDKTGKYDCVLDCGGVHSMLEPELGFAELTRSGYYHYARQQKPVIFVDNSRIKMIETCLGTGDGFLRGMKKAGYTDLAGKAFTVFGYGKVGRGIVFYLLKEGAAVTVIDDPETVISEKKVAFVSRYDLSGIAQAVKNAWCVVTATGIYNAMAGNGAAEILRNTDQIVAAMGIENEWGESLPPERILNEGAPLNFILDEPTQIRYIDPTMALLNAAAVELVTKKLPSGIQKINPSVEDFWLQTVEQNEIIAAGIKECWL